MTWCGGGRYARTSMADPLYTIAATLREAFAAVTGLPAVDIDPVVRASDRADAQANGALALAKQLNRNPRELAEAVVATGALAAVCSNAEIAGPGFINLTVTAKFLGAQVAESVLGGALRYIAVGCPIFSPPPTRTSHPADRWH